MAEILNKKETENILVALRDQFGGISWHDDFVIIRSGEKLWLTNRDVAGLDFNKLNVQVVGLYFGMVESDGIRLSIDGSQIIGADAKINTVEVSKDDVFNWLRGFDIEMEIKASGPYLLLKHGGNIIGCGKRKHGGILNLVPKDRRIKSLKEGEYIVPEE